MLRSPSGGGCKYEDWLQQKDKGAILGVNSNWITPNILAMSRPSDKMVEDQAIIFQVSPIFNGWFFKSHFELLLSINRFFLYFTVIF